MKDYNMKYCEYFDVDEKYSPCIDQSAINGGIDWGKTYPHESFVELLDTTEKMLGGVLNRSLWIHGAYGTGKSLCAYTLKKILEAPDDEVKAYWNKYETLSQKPELLAKLIGHKNQGILTAYRYSSGSITTPQQLFFAVQESVKKALDDSNIAYKGENSLKESVIAWLNNSSHAKFIDDLLANNPKWLSTFSQSTAEEIINTLRKGRDVSSLMNNLFALAAEEGITALNFTADSLKNWLIDIIKKNDIKIVFIWDEFSDFFRKNGDSLSDFQNIVSIYQEVPFYFAIVTHPLSSLAKNFSYSTGKNDPWSVVQQRFEKVEISLPDNIAFNLIHHAFNVKSAAKGSWKKMIKDLCAAVTSSSEAVSKAIRLQDSNVIPNVLPIHPMAALVLKNIATAFQSNQRSMFDFIKTPNDMDIKAFQWFIREMGPASDRPFFTIDMLWNFFYEHGKDYLTQDIRMILDTFEQQTSLKEKEEIVLKTILIMESIDKRLNGALPILKPTDQNLSYAFEGDYEDYANECKGIAKGLLKKGILNQVPIDGGKKAYTTAILAGDGAKVEGYKKDILEKSTTEKLVSECPGVADALGLLPALKLRCAIDPTVGRVPVVTISNFKKVMTSLKDKGTSWRCYTVLALAKNISEAKQFRTIIKETVKAEEYRNITIIDALETPLGDDDLNNYADYSARSMTYSGNRNTQSQDYAKKARNVLEHDWKNRIHDGQFIVYTYDSPEGDKATGANAVQTILQTIVRNRFKHVQDFQNGLNENHLKITQAKNSARMGMGDMPIKGVISGCEKYVLGKFWGKDKYWLDENLGNESIVCLKLKVDEMISESLKTTGKIAIGDIYDYLETEFGFSPCNLSAFLTGFLLKEYGTEPYRCMDEEGFRSPMTPDKLAEMIGIYFTKFNEKIPKSSYIVSLNEEEMAFYDLTETAWEISADTCTSPENASYLVTAKMRDLDYPVWCLEYVDTSGIYDLVKLYIELVRSKGDSSHDVASKIGKIALQRKSTGNNLKDLLTKENCRKGMMMFLGRFENGELLSLAKEIGAENTILSDVKQCFSVRYSALWDNSTGEEEIKKLIVKYNVIKRTNLLLNVTTSSKEDAFEAWKENLKFIGFCCDSITAKNPRLKKFFSFLHRIANSDELLPENMKSFLDEMTEKYAEIKEVFDNSSVVFSEIYSPYLKGFTPAECEEIKNSITANLFIESATSANAIVKSKADEYRNNQLKTQLYKLWSQKTKTKSPRAWSENFHMPILCCISADSYTEAKRSFSTLNSSAPVEADVKEALSFLQNATFFDDIASSNFRDECFVRYIIGDYASILPDIETVKDTLNETGITPYEWSDNPAIKAKIAELATAEYNAGGSDKAVEVIEKMTDSDLKKWLKDIVKRDMGLGVKIIINGKE